MTDQFAIQAGGLTKHYGAVHALVDLNLDVRLGEVFGFLGPNGAGKTTMIRTIMDEIRPTAGRASILGMDSHVKSVEIRRHIGYLPDDLALYPNLTGRDTLTYFREPARRGGLRVRGPAGRAAGRRPVQEGGESVLRSAIPSAVPTAGLEGRRDAAACRTRRPGVVGGRSRGTGTARGERHRHSHRGVHRSSRRKHVVLRSSRTGDRFLDGRSGRAAGATAGVMVLSFFAVGIFPLVEGWEDLAKAFPLVLLQRQRAAAQRHALGTPRRTGSGQHRSVPDRPCRRQPARPARPFDRRDPDGPAAHQPADSRHRQPTGRIGAGVSDLGEDASEYQGLLFVVAALMFGVMGVLVGPIYNGCGSSWRSPSPWSSTRWPSGSPASPA